jgi:hypothetical protein
MTPRDRRFAFAFLCATAAWSLVLAALGSTTGLLFLVPALLLALPLALGRYLGENALEAVRTRRRPRPRPARAVLPAATQALLTLLPRGGRLIAASLAKRPPPSPFAV